MKVAMILGLGCGMVAFGVGLAARALRETGVRVTGWFALQDVLEEIE